MKKVIEAGGNTAEKITKIMEAVGLYDSADDLAIQMLASQIDVYNGIMDQISETQVSFETLSDKGAKTYRANPAAKMLFEANDRIFKWMTELGLTAKSRKEEGSQSDAAAQIKQLLKPSPNKKTS